MGREAFDLVLVFLKDSKTISPSLNSKNCFVVKEKPNLDN